MNDYINITFSAEIRLTPADIDAADRNFAQAIQNEIGHTGAVVIEVETVQPPSNVSREALGEPGITES